MLGAKMQQALNKQINAEMYSAYLYLATAAAFEDLDLKGCAHWVRMQYREELLHVDKFFDFVVARDGQVKLAAIEEPVVGASTPIGIFELILAHERKVSGLIGDLVELSGAERDHACANFLQWFVSEQVEEEANVSDIVKQLRRIGDNSQGLYMLDRELAARPMPTLAPAADAAAG
jgi:ferritin